MATVTKDDAEYIFRSLLACILGVMEDEDLQDVLDYHTRCRAGVIQPGMFRIH